jgi:hypothetical protein
MQQLASNPNPTARRPDPVQARCGDIWGTYCRSWVTAPTWAHGNCSRGEPKPRSTAPTEALCDLWRAGKFSKSAPPDTIIRRILATEPPHILPQRQSWVTHKHWDELQKYGWLELEQNRQAALANLPAGAKEAPAGTPLGDWLRQQAAADSNMYVRLLNKAKGPLLADLAAGASLTVWEETLRKRPDWQAIDDPIAQHILNRPAVVAKLPQWAAHIKRLSPQFSAGIIDQTSDIETAKWVADRALPSLPLPTINKIWNTLQTAPQRTLRSKAWTPTIDALATLARNLPPELLAQLAEHGSQNAAAQLVHQKVADETTIRQVLQTVRLPLRRGTTKLATVKDIIQNPTCPPDVLIQLWRQSGTYKTDPQVGYAALRHPQLPDSFVIDIAKRHSQGYGMLPLREHLPPEAIMHLLRSPSRSVASQAAQHQDCSPATRAMWQLAHPGN